MKILANLIEIVFTMLGISTTKIISLSFLVTRGTNFGNLNYDGCHYKLKDLVRLLNCVPLDVCRWEQQKMNVTTTIVSELGERIHDIKQLIKWENWKVKRFIVKVEEGKKVEIGIELVLTYKKHKEEEEKLVDVEMTTWAEEQPFIMLHSLHNQD